MVKRYDCNFCDGMAIDDDGYFVSYDDYAALQAENDRLKAERVDLEQFRDALISLSDYAYERHGNMDHPHCIEADRLLALIDAYKGE